MLFRNRADAGRQLAGALRECDLDDPVVLALPRGGVPVAFEVARDLAVALDVIVVRKLGVPGQPELAMGAIGENGMRVCNDDVIRIVHIAGRTLDEIEQRERLELDREALLFRAGQSPRALAGRTAVIVDDGIATGSTARAACQIARAMGAAQVVLAVPVAPQDADARLGDVVDTLVCLQSPADFHSVSQVYADFGPVSDEQVCALLRAAGEAPVGHGTA